MKRTLLSILSILACASLLSLGVDSRAQAACTNASLKGTFGYTCEGTLGGLLAVEVGIGTYDGAGNVSGKSTLSVSGTAPTAITWTGSYTINADCTGAVTFGDGSHAALVLDDHKHELRVIATDPGTVYTCLKKEQ